MYLHFGASFRDGAPSCSHTARVFQASGYLTFGLFEALKALQYVVVSPNNERCSIQVVAEMLDSIHYGQHLLMVVLY